MADAEDAADLQQPGRRHHRQPRRSAAADLPAAAAGQSAAVGKGPAPCSTRSSSTRTAIGWAASAASASTASCGSNVPEDEMTLRPEDLIAAIKYLLQLRDRRSDGRGRRHRPPGQSPPADDRRAGLRRTAQGLPEAPPHRAGADEPEGRRGHDAAQPDQSQEHLGGDRVLLRPRRAVAGRRPDESAARCSRTSGGCRPSAPAA